MLRQVECDGAASAGAYFARFEVRVAGIYALRVKLDETAMTNSPTRVCVRPAALCAAKSVVAFHGVQGAIGSAKDTAAAAMYSCARAARRSPAGGRLQCMPHWASGRRPAAALPAGSDRMPLLRQPRYSP